MKISFIDEPELDFGVSSHIDMKFGIMNYGVLDFNQEAAPRKIHLGVIGTNSEIEKFQEWIEKCKYPINAKSSHKKNLFPLFPGFNQDTSFYSELISNQSIQSNLSMSAFNGLSGLSLTDRVKKAVEIYISEIEFIVSKNHKVDVFICTIPKELSNHLVETNTDSESEDEDEENEQSTLIYDFRKALKAASFKYGIPIQIVLPSTYDNSVRKIKIGPNSEGSLQDEATRAWNFYTAIYYKAGGVPWRLHRKSHDYQTCYIGISFFKSLDQTTIQTSVAQVFNERGEGIIIRGGVAVKSKIDKQVHLDQNNANELISNALKKYKKEHKTTPARVVIHKSSDFDNNEIDGFQSAIQSEGIELFDFITISKSFTRLHRNGKYPPLRGTFWELDEENKILYTKGSVDFFQTYPGLYIPKTLKMKIVFTEQTPRSLAVELMSLTKMNWNNTQFDNSLPITIKAAKQVGEILKYVGDEDYQPSYCFYM